ncbi:MULTISPECIES: hypothetical protein [Deinococcus]|uniref:Outer membrane protein beta-barrel domain-containing protein n=1 Tax=Deinococcus rufus TaxID=2136097 RepID=A0ABV7ZDN8_9DEIO|nr:hypothetical protein [Deinococcus sp. AB2017081]WQE93749.1 hypothetical protein U2P90_10045 [Deinococcus sp. AB2017081]
MKLTSLVAVTALATAATAGAQTFELGLTGGYAGGLSGEAFIHSPNLVGPVGVKFGVAYARAADAIRDSSDLGAGTFASYKTSGATESGTHTIVGLDATYGLGELAPGVDTTLYAGARYGMFKSTEDYGSNINATYSTSSLGLGGGAMVSYALSGNLSLVGDLGADYFFKSTINRVNNTAAGKTTDTYATNDPNYAGISDRFVRPGVQFKARVGIKYVF